MNISEISEINQHSLIMAKNSLPREKQEVFLNYVIGCLTVYVDTNLFMRICMEGVTYVKGKDNE